MTIWKSTFSTRNKRTIAAVVAVAAVVLAIGFYAVATMPNGTPRPVAETDPARPLAPSETWPAVPGAHPDRLPGQTTGKGEPVPLEPRQVQPIPVLPGATPSEQTGPQVPRDESTR